MRHLIAALLLLMASPAIAETWTPDQPSACNTRGTTADIAGCHMQRTKVWDLRLNDAYRTLTAMIQQMKNPAQLAALKRTERLWLDYRKENCGFYADGQGTISEILFADCMRRMTQDRAIELQRAGPQ